MQVPVAGSAFLGMGFQCVFLVFRGEWNGRTPGPLGPLTTPSGARTIMFMAWARSSRQAAGNLLHMSGWVRQEGLWLGPTIAALAGITAGSAWRWEGDTLLRAGLLLLLVDLGWGSVWWAVAGTDWASLRKRWSAWSAGKDWRTRSGLPYTLSNSPAGRLARWWRDLRSWSRAELWPMRGNQLGAVFIGLLLALALSLVLGSETLMLTLAVLAISQLAMFLGRADGEASPLAQALVGIGAPWAAGGILFGSLTGGILGAAAGSVIACAGLVRIGREKGGGVWMAIGHVGVVITLATRGELLAAGMVGALYFSQLAVIPWLRAGQRGEMVLGLAQGPFLLMMMVAAAGL